MLAIQKYLRGGKTTDDLTADFGINVTHHEKDPLVIVNYDQIESHAHRYNLVVREARALCLEKDTWNTIGLAYKRFYNLGENCFEHAAFDWQNFTCQEKIDGSCLPVVNYNGIWRMHSRGGFGQSEINGSGQTWQSLFFPLIKNLEVIPRIYSLIFEGVSLYNKVVVTYDGGKPQLFLLTVFNRETCEELSLGEVDDIADILGVRRPKVYKFVGQESMLSWIESQPGKDFEGLVIIDSNGIRMKVKVPDYVRLHHLLGGGNLFLPKYLVPICLGKRDELDEIKSTFPELIPNIEATTAKLDEAYLESKKAYLAAKDLPDAKSRALAIQSLTKYPSPCYTAIKAKRPFDDVWRESCNILLKYLF